MLKINIVRGSKDLDPVVQQIQFMEAKRSLSGDIMIFDHDLIDIVVSKEKSKVSVFPKETISEESTYVQEKLLSSLARNGIVERESIRSGSVYSSMEASILESKDEEVSSFQVTLLELYNFLESEKPNIESRKHFKQKVQDFFLDPNEKDSTELGEVPHAEKKGSLDHQVRPYGYQYMYSIMREITER